MLTDEEILDRMTVVDKEVVYWFAVSGMKPTAAAKKCYISHNGVVYHLKSVRAKTGLDPRKFFDLCKLAELIVKERREHDLD